ELRRVFRPGTPLTPIGRSGKAYMRQRGLERARGSRAAVLPWAGWQSGRLATVERRSSTCISSKQIPETFAGHGKPATQKRGNTEYEKAPTATGRPGLGAAGPPAEASARRLPQSRIFRRFDSQA